MFNPPLTRPQLGHARVSDYMQPAAVDLVASESIDDMAQREGMDPETYALALSETIRSTLIPLDVQRERLAALVSVGHRADTATARQIAQHLEVTDALFHRFSHSAVEAIERGGPKAAETSEAFLRGALRAQRASMACLSALATLRQGAPGDRATAPASAPAIGVR